MSTSLSIKGKTQANDAVTSTINYVNPNATAAQLVSLATAMNNLTTNTVSDITRIDKNSLTNTVEKLPRNLTVSPATISYATIATSVDDSTDITITGSGLDFSKLQVSFARDEGTTGAVAFGWYGSSDTEGILFAIKEANASIGMIATGVVTLTFPEDSTYQAATATLTITE